MDLRRLGEHTVQVEKASAHVSWQTKHTSTVRASIHYP